MFLWHTHWPKVGRTHHPRRIFLKLKKKSKKESVVLLKKRVGLGGFVFFTVVGEKNGQNLTTLVETTYRPMNN